MNTPIILHKLAVARKIAKLLDDGQDVRISQYKILGDSSDYTDQLVDVIFEEDDEIFVYDYVGTHRPFSNTNKLLYFGVYQGDKCIGTFDNHSTNCIAI